MAVFSGNWTDYEITVGIGGLLTITDKVTGRDGTDQLTGIERLQFADQLAQLVIGTDANDNRLAVNLAQGETDSGNDFIEKLDTCPDDATAAQVEPCSFT